MKGKLIVICGMDGSGKGTQTELLVKKLTENNYNVEKTDFPQYDNWSSEYVKRYLNGEFGTASEVGPYRGSIFYAIDRYAKSFEMQQWLQEGKIIVSNRYVSANQGHQGGKIQNKEEREKYLDWLDHLEFEMLGIPRPTINIFLHVPPEVGQKLVDQKGYRDYTQGKKRDIHESDLDHLKQAEESFLYIVDNYPEWIKIDCMKEGRLLSIEEIHQKIWEVVQDNLRTDKTTEIKEIEVNVDNNIAKEISDNKINCENKQTDNIIKVKIKRVDKSLPLPEYKTDGAAAFDLYARETTLIPAKGWVKIPSNFIFKIPKGYVLAIYARSSLAKNFPGLFLANGVGLLDSDFCGPNDELLLSLYNFSDNKIEIKKGERLAQAMLKEAKQIEIEEIEEIIHENRGGFGSTGLY